MENDDLLNVVSRQTFFGNTIGKKALVENEAGLLFIDGEIVIAKEYPNNLKMLQMMQSSFIDYMEIFTSFKQRFHKFH